MAKPLKFQIIERAKEIIQDERHWCRGYLAMDASGDSADPTSSDAVRRCALGALIAAAYQLTNDRVRGYQLALNALRPLCGSNTVVLTNDHRGHAAVLALFDEANGGNVMISGDLDSASMFCERLRRRCYPTIFIRAGQLNARHSAELCLHFYCNNETTKRSGSIA